MKTDMAARKEGRTRRTGLGMAILAALSVALLAACYSNNCPLDNKVTCNFGLYDAEGNEIKYNDTITVTTLMPGYKTVYTYRKLGNMTVVKEERDETLIEQGYSETTSRQRNDTILLNKATGASSIKLPMSYYKEADTLVFSYALISLKDTIKLRHSNYPHVELPECGAHRFHTLLGIDATDAAFDHVEIGNPHVDYDGNINVKIYFNGVAEE